MKRENTHGFTLIEILIVLVVLGALLGLALPAYQGSVEKSRKSEALMTLMATKSAEVRYYAQNNKYTGTSTDLDFDPTNSLPTGGQSAHWTYTVADGPSGAGASFKVTATRNSTDNPNGSGGGTNGKTVIVDNTGALSGTF